MKQILVTLMIFISSLIFTIPASAEFRLGAMVGTSSIASEGKDLLAGIGGTDSSGSGGVFGQWRGPVSDTVDLGFHLGFTTESAGDEAEFGRLTIGSTIIDDLTLEIESDGVIDLLGIIVWTDGTVKPFIMAGLSATQIGSNVSGTVNGVSERVTFDDSATGLKMAIGLEWPVAENWNGHAMIDYVDYGDLELFDESSLRFESEQTGIRLGIAYSF